ncbi:MAG: FG-GAP-like repeat-containing protein [Bacteroidia bacterium]
MKTLGASILFLATLAFSGGALAQSPLLTRVTSGPVVTTPSGSRSCNWLDFDRDDFQDLLITNGKQGGEDNMLYRNDRQGGFSLVADTVCHDGAPSDGATCADYDNDGFIDIYVSNWYGVDNLLYHNDMGGGFIRIDSGIVPNDAGYSETAAWGDADGDGLLDLYVANSDGNFRNFLYHNLGGGAFQKVSGIVPVTDQFRSRCVNWIDMDLDGDQDLFVTNEANQRNQLYRNDGYPTFTKISTGAIATSQFTSHSSSWGDYDNDGDFDVVVANYNQAAQLFQNDGSGNFSLISSPFGGDVGCSFSSAWADYDNDADLDLLITNGYCTSFTHNFLYENQGNGAFVRNMTEPVAIDSGSSYGCAWGDYDNDGFLDLAIANWRNETQPNYLYHNAGNANHWVEFKLEGTVSNRSAIGTIVSLQAIIQGDTVHQMREVTAQSGYCSQNSLVLHFGLADATNILQMNVTWPSGIEQTFGNITANALYSLQENGSIQVVGIDPDKDGNMGLQVFPNPSDGRFTVRIDANPAGNLQCEVTDINGRLIQSQQLASLGGTQEFSLAVDAPQGLYLLRVRDEDGHAAQRKILIVD